MKIDLHVHSRYSTRPSQWILQKLGAPESFTEPEKLYRIAKARGMDMVTISDHNRIEGALSIAHLPDTFVSMEITSYFPAERCKIHVLALNITEAQAADIQKCRKNVYELVPYLQAQNIVHVLAHPLFAVNDKLTLDHFEQMLVLFKNFELNGTRDGVQNDFLRQVLMDLTPEAIERLADKHGLEPGFPEPWKKNLTGGSDDHSALNIASMHTVVPGARNIEDFLDGLQSGESRPEGEFSSPKTMAHNLYSIAYQYYKHNFKFDRFVNKDMFLRFVDRFLSAEPPKASSTIDKLQAFFTTRRYQKTSNACSTSAQDVIRMKAGRMICDDPRLYKLARSMDELPTQAENEWFHFATRATDRVLTTFADHLLGHLSGANLFNIFQTVGSAGALYTALAPYFISYTIFTKDRRFCERVTRQFLGDEAAARPPKVGTFTDTFFEDNDVAKSLRRTMRMARQTGKDLSLLTCDPADTDLGVDVKNFTPVGVFALDEVEDLKIYYPPVLQMLDYAFEKDFTHICSATPGPIGLTGLLVAHFLKLPCYGVYHAQIPAQVGRLTNDTAMEDMTWKFLIWFYNKMDRVYVPTRAAAKELTTRGLGEDKIVIAPLGVDTSRYHPAKRNGFLAKRYNITSGVSLLYVGPVPDANNLAMLGNAFEQLRAANRKVNLIIAGDGPGLDDLKGDLADKGVVFEPGLAAEELAALYASCDIFVSPGLTETYGVEVLQAQASGLPAIVSDRDALAESIVPGETGLVFDERDAAALTSAIRELVDDSDRRLEMGVRARALMEGRSLDKVLDQTWDDYKRAV